MPDSGHHTDIAKRPTSDPEVSVPVPVLTVLVVPMMQIDHHE